MAIITSVFPAIATANLRAILAGIRSAIHTVPCFVVGRAIMTPTAKATCEVTCGRICGATLKGTGAVAVAAREQLALLSGRSRSEVVRTSDF